MREGVIIMGVNSILFLFVFVMFIILLALQGWVFLFVLSIVGVAVNITFWNSFFMGLGIAIVAGMFS